MVQLVEVEDEHFQQRQAGPEEEDGDFTDTGKSFPVVSYAWNEGHASCSDAIAKKNQKNPRDARHLAAPREQHHNFDSRLTTTFLSSHPHRL